MIPGLRYLQSVAELKIFVRTKLGPEAIRSMDQFNDFREKMLDLETQRKMSVMQLVIRSSKSLYHSVRASNNLITKRTSQIFLSHSNPHCKSTITVETSKRSL